jgi:tetratricopeptide (TPR) repeat protein
MKMSPLIVAVAVLAAVLSSAAPARATSSLAAQAPAPDATLQGRIARVRTALLSGAGRPGDLVAELQSILSADPEAAEAHLLLGLAYRSLGNDMLAEAIAEFRQALALAPALVAGRYYLAQAYLDLGRPERAREELEAALQQTPGQMQFTTLLADAERRAGNPARALQLAQEVLASDATSAQARHYAAMALLDLKRRPEAIAELERLVSAGVTPLDVTSTLGTAYLDDGRVEDAVKMLTAATEAAPARPDLQLALARAHRLAGRLADAEQRLAQVLPPGANREASEFYETIEADIHLETGLIRIAQKRDDEAVKELTTALALRPTHGPTHRHLAEVYLRQGQRAQAITHATAARDAGEVLTDALTTLLPAGATGP